MHTLIILVMGVCGSGKSSVGQALYNKIKDHSSLHQTRSAFLEGDDFHPESNKIKMQTGVALEDEDRWPWLESIGKTVKRMMNSNDTRLIVIISCSALKQTYREYLFKQMKEEGSNIKFWLVELNGPVEAIRKMMRTRSSHFMPESLLSSQLETLERPSSAEADGLFSFDISTTTVDSISRSLLDAVIKQQL